MIKHLKNNCVASDIILSDEGLQCGNCLALDKKDVYTDLTLGELLSSDNETIKRNAVSILKQLQKIDRKKLINENTTFVEWHELKCVNPKKGDDISFERDGLTWNGEVLRVCADGCDVYTY